MSEATQAAGAPRLRALVVSPSASHPRDYGNRNRVFQTADFLRRQGYEVHFVLYPMEGDWARSIPPAARAMQEHWTSFHVVPPSRELHLPAAGEDHLIDEWWDQALEDYLRWLYARQFFDVVFVNYTFLSKALELANPRSVRILDTHDKFSGRRQMLASAGVPPEFFYTTLPQEQIGFDRADLVIAIKDSEAEEIRHQTTRDVVSLPFFPDYLERAAHTPMAADPDGVLRIGFIGALNSVNSVNMEHFIRHFERLERIYAAPVRLIVAGDVCKRLYSASKGVQLLGRVAEVADFYAEIDAVVAPLQFSTGIKIKVGEALAYGKPVLATHNAYDGFPITDPYQSLPDFHALGRAMLNLAHDRGRLKQLEQATAVAAQLTRRRTNRALHALEESARRRRRRIVFITDQPFFRNESLGQSRLHQWAELSTYLARTMVLSTHQPGSPPPSDLPYEWTSLPSQGMAWVRQVRGVLAQIAGQCGRVDIVVCCGLRHALPFFSHPASADGADPFGQTQFWLDLWPAGVREMAAARWGVSAGDLAALPGPRPAEPGEDQFPLTLHTTALRYRSSRLDRIAAAAAGPETLVLACRASPACLAAASGAVRAAEGRASLIEAAPHEGMDILLLRHIAGRSRPAFIIAIGEDDAMISMLRSVCMHCAIPFADASEAALPGLWKGPDGRPSPYHEVAGMIAAILAHPAGNPQRQKEESDTGWSTFWRVASTPALA